MTTGLLVWMLALGTAGESVDSLQFLSGCWEGRLGKLVLEEQWNAPAGGMMMGMSRNLKDGKAVFSEFMRIETKGADIFYVARIGDTRQSPTPFKLVRLEGKHVVFENPEHDFPQRIIYRAAEGGLFARIEGKEKGVDRGEDYAMKSVSCGPR